jgi:hypothetical protein
METSKDIRYCCARMSNHIYRSYQAPKREGLSWEEQWEGPDRGLIWCWELGRERRKKEPELAARARNGELPLLGWKGGVEQKGKQKKKYGSLYYLAEWQGLRGEDLDIDLSKGREITGVESEWNRTPG